MMLPLAMPLFARSNPIRYTFNSFTNSATSTTTYTRSNVSIGAEATNRTVVIVATVMGGTFSSGTISSCTIGGIAATKICETTPNTNYTRQAIFAAPVPTGSNATVVFAASAGTPARWAWASYALYGLEEPLATSRAVANVSNTANSLNATVTNTKPSVVIAACSSNNAATVTHTWTGVSEEYDQGAGGSTRSFSGGTLAAPNGQSTTVAVTHSGTSSTMTLVAAAFQ